MTASGRFVWLLSRGRRDCDPDHSSVLALPAWAQSNLNKKVPKYNPAAEAVFKGWIEDMVERRCPVSGGIGSRIELHLDDRKTIEVHLATTDFSKMVQLDLRKGDGVEVTGSKTEYEGIQPSSPVK